MNKWYVYLIRTDQGALYTGITTDVDRRFNEHCSGSAKSAKYFRGKKNFELVYTKEVDDRSIASKLEYRIKKLSKRDKEALINNEIELVDIDNE